MRNLHDVVSTEKVGLRVLRNAIRWYYFSREVSCSLITEKVIFLNTEMGNISFFSSRK